VHAASVVTEHAPESAQQAPVAGGFGQGFGSQTVPFPRYVPVHWVETVTVQVPSSAQHAPVAGVLHGFGSQSVPSPW